MAWGVNLSGMQSLHSYEACKNYFEKYERPNGSKWEVWQRPLDGKTKHHIRLEKHDSIPSGAEPTYHCVLYQTAVTTYYSNGQVKVYHDQRQATREFMRSTLPRGIAPYGTWHVQVDTPEGTHWYMLSQAMMFEPAGSGKWKIMGTPMRRKKTLVDKPAAALVRKKLKPFFEWAHMTNKIVAPAFENLHNPNYLSDDQMHEFIETIEPSKLWDMHRGYATVNRDDFLKVAYKLFNCYTEMSVDNSEPPGKQWNS